MDKTCGCILHNSVSQGAERMPTIRLVIMGVNELVIVGQGG